MSKSSPVLTAFTPEMKPLDWFHENPENPRDHPDEQIPELIDSLQTHGFYKNVVARPDGTLLAGHGMILAAKTLGLEEAPVVIYEGDDIDAIRLMVGDNHLSEKAVDNKATLIALNERILKQRGSLSGTGIDLQRLQQLRNELTRDTAPPKAEEDGSDVTLPSNTKSKPGVIYELGPHRVMCGDCTDPEQVRKLIGAGVDMMLTDPPYGVDYGEKTQSLEDRGLSKARAHIADDDMEDPMAFFSSFLLAAKPFVHNAFYIFMSNENLHHLRAAIDEIGKWGDYLVWQKNCPVLSRKDYNASHEFIVYGWFETHTFYGKARTTVFECDRPSVSDLHPTMKPVPLLGELINDGAPLGGSVYDGFAGSGSTLIAAEQVGRTAYCCEIEPHYVDVIRARYAEFVDDLSFAP